MITITWRDEDYGALSGATAAFRLYGTVALSDTAAGRLASKARKAGFQWHQGRCSWISYDRGGPERLIAGFKALGFAVRSAGCRSEALAHLNSPTTLED